MTREEVKELLKFIIRKCDLIINNENYTADEYVQDKVKDIAEICHRVLDGQFDEIVSNHDDAGAPFVIVTNTKTGKWFYAKKFNTTLRSRPCSNTIVTIVPKDINDTVQVIGKCHSLDVPITKKQCIGDNKELHVEFFDEDKVRYDELFIYDAWIQSVSHETNEIVLVCDWVK